ncbi:hypothetical protein [Hymenobacter sp. AT01-02]|uniref:hypothetical protein n=1 Tax=Hymenobacter sp. AT01-02 TaxID=1571877 RepID=UPI000A54F1FE|nr:hypothetical protein [Hymenobacter sp. AT01-02]
MSALPPLPEEDEAWTDRLRALQPLGPPRAPPILFYPPAGSPRRTAGSDDDVTRMVTPSCLRLISRCPGTGVERRHGCKQVGVAADIQFQ